MNRTVGSRLRIGLLECDHVDQAFRTATGGDYSDLFAAWLAPFATSLELVAYDVAGGHFPARIDECDGYLCTGSRHGVNDDIEWIGTLRSFVASVSEAGVPCVGICFGHQMIAQALGGRVDRAPGGWGAGVHRIEVVDHEGWMEPGADRLSLHFMHQDQVLDLPPGAKLLGRAGHCPNAMFQAGSALGLQAHPEFVTAYTEALIRSRELRLGADTAKAALASLSRPTDELTAGRWVARFLGA